MSERVEWWVKGTLFENCNCQAVCPGHFHFTQDCTHERCKGFWGVEVEDGAYGRVGLAGVKAVIVFDSPRNMASGGWVVSTYCDTETTDAQLAAMDHILGGEAEGPWKVLARFMGERRPIRREPIAFTAEPKTRTATMGGILRSVLTLMKGRDRTQPVTLENCYNQIHAPRQELAMGSSSFSDAGIAFETSNTHALASQFSWSGVAGAEAAGAEAAGA